MHGKHWLVSILWLGALSILFTCVQKPTAPTNDNPFDPENQSTQGDPFHLQASLANGGITLQWQIPAVADLHHFELFKSVDSDQHFNLLERLSATTTTYTDRNISNGHTYFYRIAAVSISNASTTLSEIAPVAVSTQPVLSINGGALYCNTPQVSLTIIAGAAKEMMLANSADFRNAHWEAYEQRKTWQLDSEEGLKDVYLKIKYLTGDTSQAVSASITLDTTPPLAVLRITPDSGIVNETSFQFDPTQSRDNFTITSQLRMRLDTQNDGNWEVEWQPLDLFGQIFTLGGGVKKAHLQIKDLAGNISDTTVSFYVNTRPYAFFDVQVDAQNDRLYHFDAFESDDAEDGKHLQFRWDWQGDGTYDTPFSDQCKADHLYSEAGTYHPVLQVRDSGGLTATYSIILYVGFSLDFEKTFGGSDFDFGNDVQPTPDGGFAVAGYTKSFGNGSYDAYLIKTDASGNKVWAKTFGGAALDGANALQITDDGNWMITGSTQSAGAGKSDVWLLETDDQGALLLNKTFGGPDNDEGTAIIKTPDGGFLIVGNTQSFGAGGSDIWMIKTDAHGNKIWDRTFGRSGDDFGYGVKAANDGFVVVGATKSMGQGGFDLYVLKTDFNGRLLWERVLGGTLDDKGFDVAVTALNNIVVCGFTQSGAPGNVADGWLLKLGSNGSTLWQKTFGGDATDEFYSVQILAENGLILAGYSDSYGQGSGDMWVVKTDDEGNMQWQKTVGGANFDKAKRVRLTSSGAYVFTGSTSSAGNGSADVWLVESK